MDFDMDKLFLTRIKFYCADIKDFSIEHWSCHAGIPIRNIQGWPFCCLGMAGEVTWALLSHNLWYNLGPDFNCK